MTKPKTDEPKSDDGCVKSTKKIRYAFAGLMKRKYSPSLNN